MPMIETKKATDDFWGRSCARLVVEKQQLKDTIARLNRENKELQLTVELLEHGEE